MNETPQIVTTVAELRHCIKAYREDEAVIGFVPTMGALHDGHLSLVRETENRADVVVVSIFVNPTQFTPHEDFDRYPRNLTSDAEKLGLDGAADLIFAPSAAEIYPSGFATRIDVGGPGRGLETDFRPQFFSGVAIIVLKLLLAAMPDIATFGEKDYQQLLVIRRLAADLGLTIEIVGAPTIREPDGLAMSSRNAYLSPAERKIAGQLNTVLRTVIDDMRRGIPIAAAEQTGKQALLKAGFGSVDYLAVRDAEDLSAITNIDKPARVLAAARIGAIRLIDNMAV